jgi:uncharacterized protein YllA (UPF0747 family)
VVDEKQNQTIKKLGLKQEDIFKDEHAIMKHIVDINTNSKYALNGELKSFEDLYNILETRSANIDATLTNHVEALKTKAIKKLVELEKKLLRAEKRKFAEQQVQIKKIKSTLFPGNSLQERVENISGLYAVHGKEIFTAVYYYSKGLHQQFAIMDLISAKK